MTPSRASAGRSISTPITRRRTTTWRGLRRGEIWQRDGKSTNGAGKCRGWSRTRPDFAQPQWHGEPARGADAADPCRARLRRYDTVLPLRSAGSGPRATGHHGSAEAADPIAAQPAGGRRSGGTGGGTAALRSAVSNAQHAAGAWHHARQRSRRRVVSARRSGAGCGLARAARGDGQPGSSYRAGMGGQPAQPYSRCRRQPTAGDRSPRRGCRPCSRCRDCTSSACKRMAPTHPGTSR